MIVRGKPIGTNLKSHKAILLLIVIPAKAGIQV